MLRCTYIACHVPLEYWEENNNYEWNRLRYEELNTYRGRKKLEMHTDFGCGSLWHSYSTTVGLQSVALIGKDCCGHDLGLWVFLEQCLS